MRVTLFEVTFMVLLLLLTATPAGTEFILLNDVLFTEKAKLIPPPDYPEPKPPAPEPYITNAAADIAANTRTAIMMTETMVVTDANSPSDFVFPVSIRSIILISWAAMRQWQFSWKVALESGFSCPPGFPSVVACLQDYP